MFKRHKFGIIIACIVASGQISASERLYGLTLGIIDHSRINNITDNYLLHMDARLWTFPYKYAPNSYYSPEIGLFVASTQGNKAALTYSQWRVMIDYIGYGRTADHVNIFRQNSIFLQSSLTPFYTYGNKLQLYLTGGMGIVYGSVKSSIPDSKVLDRFKPSLSGNIGLGLRAFISKSSSIEFSIVYSVGDLKNEYFHLVDTDIDLSGVILKINMSFYLIKPNKG